ncbi:MAG: family 1 glycosylhydrolase [Cyclobacteriaceae bacterium]
MKIKFPEDFIFGTSTSAYQIETAFEHDWVNVRSGDGNTFNRTTDHEKRLLEDVEIIASLAPHYRMSLMWSKLQRQPYARLNSRDVEQYATFLKSLNDRHVKVMMVIHHFANPTWFANSGGWQNKKNIDAWFNYAVQLFEAFGPYVDSWNTFNEPNLYTSLAYVAGEFPPFKKNILAANRVIRNIAIAHNMMYDHIKKTDPGKLVGISHNCALFKAENLLGRIPAKVCDWCYMTYPEDLFRKTDFFGMSYYARIGFDPFPITYIKTPGKLEKSGKPHDDMWEYYPKGLEECIIRFWEKYQKPIIITENGFCTSDDKKRMTAISDYMKALSDAMAKGADVRGYYHWSTWDNFEWSLGPTFQFGLYSCDPSTKERKKKPSADLFSSLAFNKELEINGSPG